jgi:hypothetical protein
VNVLSTVTLTFADVRVLLDASRATAVRTCGPLVVSREFQATEYGAVVSSLPIGCPSTRNCTPATESLSLAVASTVTTPDTVAPLAGAVMSTLGSTVSGVAVPLASPDAGPTLCARSSAVTL